MISIPSDAYILIIGAMKCGTSTLYQLLAQHPQICSSKIKEPEFFSENQRHKLQVKHYNELWHFDRTRHKYVVEGSTGYTKFPIERNVPKKIREYGISPIFIYVVRDPLQRIESHYNFSSSKSYFNPDTAITDERYVCYSRYFTQLEEYRKYFVKERIRIIDFEELVNRPDSTMEILCCYLGIQYFGSKGNRVHINKTELPIKGKKEIKSMYKKLGKIYLFKTLSDKLPMKFKQEVLGKIKRSISNMTIFRMPKKKRILTHHERNEIRGKIEDEMKKFKEEYGFPVEKWGFK